MQAQVHSKVPHSIAQGASQAVVSEYVSTAEELQVRIGAPVQAGSLLSHDSEIQAVNVSFAAPSSTSSTLLGVHQLVSLCLSIL